MFLFLKTYEERKEEKTKKKSTPSVSECCSHGCDNDVFIFRS